MSNPSVVSLQLTAGSSNGISLAQTPGAAGALILNGALVASGVANLGAVARRVAAVSANAGDTTQTIAVTGTDRNGNVISENLKLNGVTTVYTNQDFLTVTSEVISAATAGNITSGTNGVASTVWVLDNFLAPTWMLSVAVHLPSGANSATYTVEHTYDDPNSPPGFSTGNSALPSSMEPASNYPPLAWANPTLRGFTTDGEFQYVAWPVMAHRLTITAGTGQAIMQSIQAGLGSP